MDQASSNNDPSAQMSPAEQKVVERQRLPDHLEKYRAPQCYESYSAENHATWRVIMSSAKRFLPHHAVPVYLKGLEETGISLKAIPRIEDMDAKLAEFGWHAMGVDGFISSPAFLELLSRKVLPIAMAMRRKSNFSYTSAPDIVHEAAGHAPILADEHYRQFLESYSNAASKAVISRKDLEVYEWVRKLSDIKELRTATAKQIREIEGQLQKASDSVKHLSEAAKTSRLAWWTIEFGLVGSLSKPKIFGAALLSSVLESRRIYDPEVKKIRFGLDEVLQTNYDITKPQPQLFVLEDLKDLTVMMQEFEKKLAFKRGGLYALKQGMHAELPVQIRTKGSGDFITTIEWVDAKDDQSDWNCFIGQNPDKTHSLFYNPTMPWSKIEMEGEEVEPGVFSNVRMKIGAKKINVKKLKLVEMGEEVFVEAANAKFMEHAIPFTGVQGLNHPDQGPSPAHESVHTFLHNKMSEEDFVTSLTKTVSESTFKSWLEPIDAYICLRDYMPSKYHHLKTELLRVIHEQARDMSPDLLGFISEFIIEQDLFQSHQAS